jgi:hypothetical protein
MTGLEVARARNLSPTLIVECAGHCTNKFPLGEGYPFPVHAARLRPSDHELLLLSPMLSSASRASPMSRRMLKKEERRCSP